METTNTMTIRDNILKGFEGWLGEDGTEQEFNSYLESVRNGEDSIAEIDNILNNTKGLDFDYVTWLCDRNSNDIVIQISVYIKGGMSLTIESMNELPFKDLDSCADWILKTNPRINELRITDYTDVGGEKTQIIIDHNIN